MLDGKSIVIIGGTTGLGLSAARACIAAHAKVVVVGRNEAHVAEAVNSLGDSCRGVSGDACDPQTAVKAIELASESFGQFDALYHVAGGSGRSKGDGPLDSIPDEGWHATLEWNLSSVFYSNRAATQYFLRNARAGCVLNMASVLAASPSPRYFSTHAYATAKAAIIGLTRACAAHYAPQNIRFNAIAPGLVDTPMAQRAVSDAAINRFVRTKQPLDGGRVERPDDLDAAVVYLLSDGARFVTGQVLAVDGGWSLSEGQFAP